MSSQSENALPTDGLEALATSELLTLINIERELENRLKRNPLKYFWPHQKNCNGYDCSKAVITYETFDGVKHQICGCPQYEFLASSCSTKSFFGSNRSGKSTAGIYEWCVHVTGEYPSWWKGKRYDRPVRGRIFANGFTKGVLVITEKLKEWLPKGSWSAGKNSLGAEINWRVKHVSGSESVFDILSYEQDSSAAEGANHDLILFDEPPPRAMYIAAVRGLVDSGGICMFTLTPLREPWLFDEIYNSKNTDIFSVLCDMRHNLLRYNPLSRKMVGLEEENIRKFEKTLTEEERETRMHGKFRYLAGRVWKEWDREVHTFDRHEMWKTSGEGRKRGVVVDGYPPSHWPRCLIIDPHDRNPQTLTWVALDETGDSWFYREGWLKDATIPDTVTFIRKVELEARERVGLRILDPNFGPKRYANTGNTVRDEFEQAGRKINYPVRFTFGDDHMEIGHKAVAMALKFDKSKPLGLLNHPKWHFASDLRTMIYQIEHYIWDEFKMADRDPKEKPKDLNKHFPDTLRYYALSGMKWGKPVVHEGKGSFYN